MHDPEEAKDLQGKVPTQRARATQVNAGLPAGRPSHSLPMRAARGRLTPSRQPTTRFARGSAFHTLWPVSASQPLSKADGAGRSNVTDLWRARHCSELSARGCCLILMATMRQMPRLREVEEPA